MRTYIIWNTLVLVAAIALVADGCSTSNSKRNPAQEQDVNTAHAEPHSHMGMAALQTATIEQCETLGALSTTASTAQANAVFNIVGNRGHRLQHALWHAARGGFTKAQDSEVLKAFGATWTEPHHYCEPSPPGADWKASGYNPVGEDFLYMHHNMVGIVRGALFGSHLQCLAGWSSVQDSTNDPLPNGVEATGPKSNATLQQLLAWDKYFQGNVTVTTGCPSGKTSCNWLETVSLSQLGMAIELTTHNNLHMRFATDDPPTGFEGAEKDGGAPIPYNNLFPASWTYDQQGYDWLADPYGAAVNPTFWKIHGYVDGLIYKWLAANGFKTIADSCAGQSSTDCYEWKGTWAPPEPDATTEAAVEHAVAGPSDADDAAATAAFNKQRMLKQWKGVLGRPKWASEQDVNSAANAPIPTSHRPARPKPSAKKPPAKTPSGGGTTTTTTPDDPFAYSVQSECNSSN